MKKRSSLVVLRVLIAVFLWPVTSLSHQATTEPVVEEVEVQSNFLTARDAQTLGQLLVAEKIFNELQSRAPKADFRFKVFGRQDASQWKAADLELLTPQSRIPVPVDQDGRFGIDAAWRALPPETELRSRLRDGKVTWRADVRTPGTTMRTRRLGDLRLQCEASFWSGVARGTTGSSATNRVLRSALNGCDSKWFGWSAFADAPVFGIRFIYGDRAMHLSLRNIGGLGDPSFISGYDWTYALRERMYRLYLGDHSWPDDTIVEFEFVDDPAAPIEPSLLSASNRLAETARLLQPGVTTLVDVKKRIGSGRGTLSYSDGRRAVLYRLTGRQELELVALFDSDDRLVKYALRPTDIQKLTSSLSVPW